MRFLVFVKRYVQTPLFITICISAALLLFLYQNSDMSVPGNIRVGVYATGDDEGLISKLEAKKSYFKYYKYDDVSKLQDDVKKRSMTYGFAIDMSREVPFVIYGSDDKFSEVAKEDFYSTYFEILSEKYTKDLLKLDEQDYQKLFYSQIGRTYKFEYVDDDDAKVFPLRESSAVLLFISMLLICLDYFNITEKNEFFSTFVGRKSRAFFVISSMSVNFVVYLIMLFVGSSVNLPNFIIYNIILSLIAYMIVSFSSKDYFIKAMPIAVMMSVISVFMSKVDRAYFIYLLFPSNSYVASYSSFFIIIIYLVLTLVLATVLRLKSYAVLKNM